VRVIGLMSGTSVDGIDAALVDISGRALDLRVNLLAATTYAYTDTLRQQILAVCAGQPLSPEALAQLDDAIAQAFAQAAIEIQQGQPPAELIGSHGQTIFHRPPEGTHLGYTWQLGRGEVIAQQTGLPCVNQFRHADIAAGGQGAPLVSRIDACLLSHPQLSRCVQNIGGIGNVTFLPPVAAPEDLGQGVIGWDTGPGNVLIDLAVQKFSEGQLTYDQEGAWAATGHICQPLVQTWLAQDYFQEPPPKSTGRELFSPAYLEVCLEQAAPYQLQPADILATLTELTAASIVLNYQKFLPQPPKQVLLCGGGARNRYLRERLTQLLTPAEVMTTAYVGLSVDAKEAIAFAVLAYWQRQQIPGNLPGVTGAKQEQVLGIFHPNILARPDLS
jgi:anhydro-N-acetylmuramic acid kinase